METDREALARIDRIASALVRRAAPVTFRLARTPADVAAAERLRGRAVIERGWLDPEHLVDGREHDVDDDRATHLLAVLDGGTIGTCRLVYPESGRLLPMEKRAGAIRVPRPAAEVGRVVVIRALARTEHAVTAGLVARAWLETRAYGHARICGTVSVPMLRLFRRIGFRVEVVGPPVRTFGEERHPILFEPDAEAAAAAAARHAE